MRRIAVALLVGLALIGPSTAEAATGRDETPGGQIIDETPTAIVVSSPGGALDSYERGRGGSGARWTCRYFPFTGVGGGLAIDHLSDGVNPVEGDLVALYCFDQTGALVRSEILVYDPGDPMAGLFAAERAAERALGELELPQPQIATNPAGDQLVGLPTWLWLTGGWGPLSTSASIGGVTSTVTATPRHVDWDLGDGTSLRCDGPGVPYDPAARAASQTSDCATTFIHTSASRPGGVHRLTASVTYAVAWSANTGEGAELGDLTSESSVDVRVIEVQAVIG